MVGCRYYNCKFKCKKYFLEDTQRRLIAFSSNTSPEIGFVNAFLNSPSNTNFLSSCKNFIREKLYNINTQTDLIVTHYFNKIFILEYVKQHLSEFKFFDRKLCFPDMIYYDKEWNNVTSFAEYHLYNSFTLKDMNHDMIMLCNSQIPDFIKKLSKDTLFSVDCTLTNILAEILDIRLPENRTKLSK